MQSSLAGNSVGLYPVLAAQLEAKEDVCPCLSAKPFSQLAVAETIGLRNIMGNMGNTQQKVVVEKVAAKSK